MKKHPLSWFEARIPKTIVRVRINDDGEEVRSYVPIKDNNYAKQYFATQSKEMHYTDNTHTPKPDPIDDMKPIIRIHKHPLSECESCSA